MLICQVVKVFVWKSSNPNMLFVYLQGPFLTAIEVGGDALEHKQYHLSSDVHAGYDPVMHCVLCKQDCFHRLPAASPKLEDC